MLNPAVWAKMPPIVLLDPGLDSKKDKDDEIEHEVYVEVKGSRGNRRRRTCLWALFGAGVLLLVGLAVALAVVFLVVKPRYTASSENPLSGANGTNLPTQTDLGLPGVEFPKPAFLNVLLLGDSLTAGQHGNPVEYSPYGTPLLAALKQDARLSDVDVKVVIQGVGGDRVNYLFGRRLMDSLQEADKESTYFTHAVILGGVNDINLNHSQPIEVFEGLRSLYNSTLSHNPGTHVIACTIMENGFKSDEPDCAQRDANRKALNAMLRDAYSGGKVPRVSLLDLERLLPFESLTEWERFVLFDDSLHLTLVGYSRMAGYVYDHIIKLLANSTTSAL